MTQSPEMVAVTRELVSCRINYSASPVTVEAVIHSRAGEFAQSSPVYVTDAALAEHAAADGRTTWDERDVFALLADPTLAPAGSVSGAPSRVVALPQAAADEFAARDAAS